MPVTYLMMKFKMHIILAGCLFAAFGCHKDKLGPAPVNPPAPAVAPAVDYGDSVFYLDPANPDVRARPKGGARGRYYGFPEGIVLDQNTGIIDISKSETGLRYRVSFVADGGGDTLSSMVTVSGINFLDGFYRLSTADSIVHPMYNGRKGDVIPGVNGGSVFDEGNGCNSQGCTVNTGNGEINLAQTVRNGVFGAVPVNNDRHEFVLRYRIDDRSGKAANALNVKLYYFETMNDVTPEVYDILNSRQGTILAGVNAQLAKPRPPCIFIIAH